MRLVSSMTRIAALFIVTGALFTSAFSQSSQRDVREKQHTQPAGAVGVDIYDKLQDVQEYIDSEKFDDALRIVNTLYDPAKLNDYERSQVLQFKGFILYTLGNTLEAIGTFETILTIPGLEPAARKQHLYTLAQLYAVEERFDAALRYLDEWFRMETNPGSKAWVFLAQLRYQLDDHTGMIRPLETAVALTIAQSKAAKEEWYAVLGFAYAQREDYGKVRDIQKTLLESWPRTRYWKTLAGSFAELGDEDALIAAYSAAHTNGLLTEEPELISLAQLYLQKHVPYKAAVLLQTSMDDGRVERSARNYRLLSQAWTLAQEDEKAVPALIEAARLSDDGELDIRLANAYLSQRRYEDCAAAARRGIHDGGLKKPGNASVSLGMCLYNLRNYGAARTAFARAADIPANRQLARRWLDVIQREIERNAAIDEAVNEAQKKIDALHARRRDFRRR